MNPDGKSGRAAVIAGEGAAPVDVAAAAGQGAQERSLTRDVFGTYGTRLLTIGLSLFTGIITARMLGPHNRGVFALVYQFAATVVTFAKLGFAQSSVYSIRRERAAPERVAANALFVALVLGVLSAGIVYLLREQLLGKMLRGVPEWAFLISL